MKVKEFSDYRLNDLVIKESLNRKSLNHRINKIIKSKIKTWFTLISY